MYSLKYNEEATTRFLHSVKDLRTIDMTDKNHCDTPLAVEEVVDSIALLKNNKSPGTDGITAEFYKSFSNQLAPFLRQVFFRRLITVKRAMQFAGPSRDTSMWTTGCRVSLFHTGPNISSTS